MDKTRNLTAFQRAMKWHWWDEHPPADPESEPLYALALEGHVAEVA